VRPTEPVIGRARKVGRLTAALHRMSNLPASLSHRSGGDIAIERRPFAVSASMVAMANLTAIRISVKYIRNGHTARP
jgi:hypothetical protein